jgi:C_GCAxxG_C_C family probable redox protein
MKKGKRVEQAVAHFADGYLCSQSVLLVHAEPLGLDPETAARIAGPFGAGMARMGWTCGAVTGALMVIGLRYGFDTAGDVETKERMYEKEREFLTAFRARNGSVVCRELLDRDLSTPEGLDAARQERLFETRCPGYIEDAVEILGDILDEE